MAFLASAHVPKIRAKGVNSETGLKYEKYRCIGKSMTVALNMARR
jgi:hypothetical protein